MATNGVQRITAQVQSAGGRKAADTIAALTSSQAAIKHRRVDQAMTAAPSAAIRKKVFSGLSSGQTRTAANGEGTQSGPGKHRLGSRVRRRDCDAVSHTSHGVEHRFRPRRQRLYCRTGWRRRLVVLVGAKADAWGRKPIFLAAFAILLLHAAQHLTNPADAIRTGACAHQMTGCGPTDWRLQGNAVLWCDVVGFASRQRPRHVGGKKLAPARHNKISYFVRRA